MKHATPRTSQQPKTNAHACVARYNDRHKRKGGTRRDPGSWEGDGNGGERRQRRAVDQAEHDKREADCAQTGRTAWVAADDRDPHRIVEAAGKDDTDQRRAAVAGYKGKWRGPLAVRKQPRPPECLERLSNEKQQSGRDEQAWLAVRERPRPGRKMTDSQKCEDEHDGDRSGSESPARPPRVSKLPERLHQQPIAALEHDRCSRDSDRRQRISLQPGIRREGRWSSPHALPSGDHRSMPPHAGTAIGAPDDQRRGATKARFD
jgi:hypothetical protein